jgi:hypothetical protein
MRKDSFTIVMFSRRRLVAYSLGCDTARQERNLPEHTWASTGRLRSLGVLAAVGLLFGYEC